MDSIFVICEMNGTQGKDLIPYGFKSKESAVSYLNKNLPGDLHWISEILCRYVVGEDIVYYMINEIPVEE